MSVGSVFGGSRGLVALGLGCLLAAHAVALVAWPRRPAAATGEYLASDENLGEVFVEMEPGEFAGTLMLGGLRGLVTDLLWLRATGAKERGRYYESVALAKAITRVQPRFEQVWEFLAHDLAYNIAVEVSPEDRWNWYLVGLEAVNRGVRRNPRSVRLLRFHAWMFQHKGENYMERVERHDWSGLLNPVLARQGDAVAPIPYGPITERDGDRLRLEPVVGDAAVGDPFLVMRGGEVAARATVVARADGALVLRLEDALDPDEGELAAVASLSSFQLAGRLYRAALALGAKQDMRVPSYVRRLVALGIEKDGNRLRNRGEHLAALERYLASLEDWQDTVDWVLDPASHQGEAGLRSTLSSYERNEGQLRRRAAMLGRQLAPNPITAAAFAHAVMQRDLVAARWLLEFPGWQRHVGGAGGVRWLDED